MTEQFEALLSTKLLVPAPIAAVRAAASRWSSRTAAPGEVIWRPRERVDELAVLVSGRLEASVSGVIVGGATPGDLCGDVSSFFLDLPRGTRIRAAEPSALLVLDRRGLERMSDEAPRVYHILLERAQLHLARRVREVDERIARIARGAPRPRTRAARPMLARLWRAARPDRPSEPPTPASALLRGHPLLKVAEESVIQEVSEVFRPRPVEAGEVLFEEGSVGVAAYLVAVGRVDVLRDVAGGRVKRLATLGPGDLFGVNALVESSRRTATCVMATGGWLHRVGQHDFHRPEGVAGLLWRQLIIHTLASQLHSAIATLGQVSESASEDETLGYLLDASAALTAAMTTEE